METIQQQKNVTKKSERTKKPKELKGLYRKFCITAWIPKGSLAEGRKNK